MVVTPTASGKTLCYNLPVLDRILKDPDARALYLFPTKALAQDQLAELHGLIEAIGADIGTFTYDGDTPQDARKAIRARAHVVVTNPDMLHKGILPHHTKWVKLLREPALRGRGRAAQPARGLRLARREHLPAAAAAVRVLRLAAAVHLLLGHDRQPEGAGRGPHRARDDAGRRERRAPRRAVLRDLQPAGREPAARHPQVGPQLGPGRRRSRSSSKGLQTIVFAPSRLATEVLVTYLKEALETKPGSEGIIRGYRGGYLPLKRREIERGLREGSVLGVVSTNALELGIDIGSLDAAVLVGYPGSVASAWQQAGRAGRRTGTSVAVLVANSTPLNQFIAKNPDYFFGAPVEQARINPDNLQILVNHIKCAAFELPFVGDERFGKENLLEILKYLEEEKLLHRAGERWHWTSESYPADAISLRSVSSDNFVIQDVTREPRIVAEVDYDSAPSMVHEKAIYILEGRTYFVEKYDHEERRVRRARGGGRLLHRRHHLHEGADPRALRGGAAGERPAQPRRGARRLAGRGLQEDQVPHQRERGLGRARHARERDAHHRRTGSPCPARPCAALPFSLEERRDGVVALSYTLGQLAALFLMCDRHDLGVALGDNGQGEARIERGLVRLGRAGGARDEPPRRRRLRAQRVPLRRLPGRHRPVRAALPPPRPAAGREPGAHRRLPLPRRLSVLRGAGRARSAAAARKWPWRSSTRSCGMRPTVALSRRRRWPSPPAAEAS